MSDESYRRCDYQARNLKILIDERLKLDRRIRQQAIDTIKLCRQLNVDEEKIFKQNNLAGVMVLE